MNIPPFPSQDLAKLVLGYLAEEQLMTAYDEFLQASPYLDALRNEYDRIFMTSLKNILAEYRAVKIYVETCKPIALRRKLFQCSNLLETIKLLVNHIDLNKVTAQSDTTEKNSLTKHNTISKLNLCEVCSSLRLEYCVCNKGRNKVKNLSETNVESNSSESSVEATLLTDLPGNHGTTTEKNGKVFEKDNTTLQSTSGSSHQSSELGGKHIDLTNNGTQNISTKSLSIDTINEKNSLVQHSLPIISTDQLNTQQYLFKDDNHVSGTVDTIHYRGSKDPSLCGNKTIFGTNTFGELASGFKGGDSGISNVPDSSTSEILKNPVSTTKEFNIEPSSLNLQDPMKCQYLLKVGNVTNTLGGQSCMNISNIEEDDSYHYPKTKSKPEDNKIKILSDVKFGRNKNIKAAATAKNATSTPLTQMKTIFINGTPAYRHKSLGNPQNFTKDEIMAMPTIIVVPASGSVKIPKKAQSRTSATKKSRVSNIKTMSTSQPNSTSSATPILGPLVIDVSNSSISSKLPKSPCVDTLTQPSLIKTAEMVKTASMPKDSIASTLESSTPQVLVPVRKSSSTPRRSSHVRVLDFSTPRRILHGTIHERAESQNSDIPAEVVLSSSPVNTQAATTLVLGKCDAISPAQNSINDTNVDNNNDQNESAKENTNENNVVKDKKQSWDADLRALLNGNEVNESSKSGSKSKIKNTKKRKSINLSKSRESEIGENKPSKSKCKNTPKTKRCKKKVKCEEEDPDCVVVSSEKVQSTVKPTINIICKPNWGTVSVEDLRKEEDCKQGNPNVNEHVITPETERVSLQNIIGAKLDISDLLETPYKQALYDIQMETPKFLGSDLPDYPMSDVKIMNIPTPRFLNTPKPIQPTPPSYSSRPTDYSSGGSYYKPDEQDYAPAPDFTCKISPSKDDIVSDLLNQNEQITKKVTTRPVRQCTKNVSYYKNMNITNNKAKENDDNASVSSCSDSTNAHISFENDKEIESKKSKSIKDIDTKQATPKQRTSLTKKRKSPIKKIKSNSFMKIKPRRPTPIKESKRKSYLSKTPLKSQIQKRNSIKDKRTSSPLIVSAPTKSRRKSSTPRKINCTKTFNSESSGHDSPDIMPNTTYEAPREPNVVNNLDSDTEHIALRWSDDGSQESKTIIVKPNRHTVSESDDISKIKEYIETTAAALPNDNIKNFLNETSLQADLIKRGFDVETAKSIERDLLDTPPHSNNKSLSHSVPEAYATKINGDFHKIVDSSSGDPVPNQSDEMENDEIELSVHECNEESVNHIAFRYDDTTETLNKPDVKLKDKFSMEVCIDDGVVVRLRATPFTMLFDHDPECIEELNYSYRETVVAVKSISNINTLYTPIKDPLRAQCYEIFDSTLTSIDTPLKVNSSQTQKLVVPEMEIILEEEPMNIKEKVEGNIRDNVEAKKRKRLHSTNSSDDSSNGNTNKKAKSETQYLLSAENIPNIQNFDIESVLKKLHGP